MSSGNKSTDSSVKFVVGLERIRDHWRTDVVGLPDWLSVYNGGTKCDMTLLEKIKHFVIGDVENHRIMKKKKISIIAAMDENRVIGKDNKLPWHIPEDLKWFKKLTKNKTIVMGRKTYESIGKPLPYRNNIVVTRDPEFRHKIGYESGAVYKDDVLVGSIYIDDSLEHAIENWSFGKDTELMVIGGASIYEAVLPIATKMYITRIYAKFDGDSFFPEYEDKWEVISSEVSSDKNYTYEFQILEPRVCDEQ